MESVMNLLAVQQGEKEGVQDYKMRHSKAASKVQALSVAMDDVIKATALKGFNKSMNQFVIAASLNDRSIEELFLTAISHEQASILKDRNRLEDYAEARVAIAEKKVKELESKSYGPVLLLYSL